MNDEDERPTALDQLVSELNHTGKSQYFGLLFPVTARLHPHLYGMLEVLTHHAGTVRNKVLNQLLEVGIEATLNALPDELCEDFQRQSSQIQYEAMKKKVPGFLERGEA